MLRFVQEFVLTMYLNALILPSCICFQNPVFVGLSCVAYLTVFFKYVFLSVPIYHLLWMGTDTNILCIIQKN